MTTGRINQVALERPLLPSQPVPRARGGHDGVRVRYQSAIREWGHPFRKSPHRGSGTGVFCFLYFGRRDLPKTHHLPSLLSVWGYSSRNGRGFDGTCEGQWVPDIAGSASDPCSFSRRSPRCAALCPNHGRCGPVIGLSLQALSVLARQPPLREELRFLISIGHT